MRLRAEKATSLSALLIANGNCFFCNLFNFLLAERMSSLTESLNIKYLYSFGPRPLHAACGDEAGGAGLFLRARSFRILPACAHKKTRQGGEPDGLPDTRTAYRIDLLPHLAVHVKGFFTFSLTPNEVGIS